MFYSTKPNFNTVAYNLIHRNGVVCTYSKITQGVYDPELSSVSNTSVDFTVIARPTQASFSEKNSPNMINLDLKVFLLANTCDLGFVPSNEDIITFNSTAHKILSTVPIYGNNQDVAYWRLITKVG